MTKDQARAKLRDAVRRGLVAKPDRCSVCGKETERRFLHGHHANGYEDAFDVEWVCIHCHNKTDKAARVENGHKMRSNLIPNAFLIYGKRDGRV